MFLSLFELLCVVLDREVCSHQYHQRRSKTRPDFGGNSEGGGKKIRGGAAV